MILQFHQRVGEADKRFGHESVETTSIYLQVVGEEAHSLEERAWKKANGSWGK
ncbi:MAG: hypothetical protein KZQ86_10500 [Candidatus Thiodiazotropha sp. (ex Lucinoma kastoroae)]|nr:hypothetical protein [Candidatus Thiodiazotropha sp. (ex Lucinoma kastoroae)]